MPEFDPQACQARNRRFALRGGLSAAPVQLGKGSGGLMSEGEALARINALRRGGDELTAADVHIRYAEAANANYIPSRYMFLAESTLRNIAEGANEGVAFMNSHRTGGFSTESELPFGQTFWGQYAPGKATVGVFMLRGMAPNGANGPTTDDLAAMIDAGTLRDVSVGLYGGEALCDLCDRPVDSYGEEGCPHAPGTHRGLSAAQMDAQRKRGVPDGCATYSLHRSRFGEVSAVFDGAVPGAGFRKALKLAAKGELSALELAQARTSYVALCRTNDFQEVTPEVISQLAQALNELWAEPEDAEALAASSFSAHSQSVLAAVTEYVERAERYVALRAQDNRLPSAERLSDWQALHARLSELLARSTPKAERDQLLTLRVRHLQRQAKRRAGSPASSFAGSLS